MAYAQIKDQWYQSANPKTSFCLEGTKEGHAPNAIVYETQEEGGERHLIASLPLRGLPDAVIASELENFVTRHGFQPIPGAPKFEAA